MSLLWPPGDDAWRVLSSFVKNKLMQSTWKRLKFQDVIVFPNSDYVMLPFSGKTLKKGPVTLSYRQMECGDTSARSISQPYIVFGLIVDLKSCLKRFRRKTLLFFPLAGYKILTLMTSNLHFVCRFLPLSMLCWLPWKSQLCVHLQRRKTTAIMSTKLISWGEK